MTSTMMFRLAAMWLPTITTTRESRATALLHRRATTAHHADINPTATIYYKIRYRNENS